MDKFNEYYQTRRQFETECKLSAKGEDMGSIMSALHWHESALHTLAEAACNGELTDSEQRREKNARCNVENMAERLGFKVKFNSDPRGGAIRFILPSGRSNNWDNETWGIYW